MCKAATKKYREVNYDKYIESKRRRYNARKDTPEFKALRRKHNLKMLYGITPEQYDLMLLEQNNCCAICGTDNPGKNHKKFSVDHDHETKKIRGLLCNDCNRGLGLLGDDLQSIQNVLTYILKSEGVYV